MNLPENPFKRALAAGKRQIGCWMTLASPMATEIAAGAGFDWLLIDMEHAPNELPDVIDHLRAVAAARSTAEPIIRAPWNDAVTVKRLLDAGVRSLMFPFVQSAEEARRAVAATRYPPHGIRGFSGSSRAQGFGRIKDYAARCAEEICVIVQIETPKALAAIGEIAAVEGVDGVFVGPNDLAANMGHLAKTGAPEVKAAVLEALKRIKASGKAPGLLNHNETEAKELFDAGYLFISVGSDTGLLTAHADGLARRMKATG
jgi:4-hydroxy-2-oxoheptanedioate aldolase